MKQKLELKKPILINGSSYKELEYDFDEITCEDYAMAAAYADAKSLAASQQGKPNASVMEQNINFLMYLGMFAIKASNKELVDISDLERIKGFDLVEITRLGRNFIMGRSVEPSDQNSLEGQSEVTPVFTTQELKK
ncbi:MAG: early nodulin 20 (N-20) [Lachnospiraceae bacterium]